MRKNKIPKVAFHPLPWLLLMLLAGGCGSGDPRPRDDLAEVSPAHVEFVRMIDRSDGWEVSVTVLHEDSGWDHYADWWRVIDPDGRELAKRVLRHPHVDEQPFTRSLMSVIIPPGLQHVVVEANCSVHGTGGRTVTVDLSLHQGPGFTVSQPRGSGQ